VGLRIEISHAVERTICVKSGDEGLINPGHNGILVVPRTAYDNFWAEPATLLLSTLLSVHLMMFDGISFQTRHDIHESLQATATAHRLAIAANPTRPRVPFGIGRNLSVLPTDLSFSEYWEIGRNCNL
jgi:hypothetical protein